MISLAIVMTASAAAGSEYNLRIVTCTYFAVLFTE